jgi:hypothetical protein
MDLGSGCVGGFQGDLVTQALKLANQPVVVRLGGLAVSDVVGAKVASSLPLQ